MWKVTFFFSQGNQTWTETWYLAGNTSLSQVFANCQGFAQYRAGCNAPGCVLTAIRLVNSNNPRNSTFMTPGTFVGNGTFTFIPGTDPDQDPAPSFVAVQVKFGGALLNTARRYMSGAPEGIVGTKLSAVTNLQPLGLWQNAFNAFGNFLSGLFSFRYRNQAANQPVQAVLTNAQFAGEIGVQFGQQMISGPGPWRMAFKGFRKVNYRQFGIQGVYNVDPLSPGITASVAPYIYYLQNTANVLPANIAVRGVGAQLLYGFDTVASWQVLSARHRKRGASALAPRGRSRSKP
jgi:hypothetical protein